MSDLPPALATVAQQLNDAIAQSARDQIVAHLLQAEKLARQTKTRYGYSQLLGDWRLTFITGTQKTRQRAGVMLGAGRFLPGWVSILLSYTDQPVLSDPQQDLPEFAGSVQNSVQVGLVQFTLSGPTRFWPQRNILAFDFTRMQATVGGLSIYNGYIRGGAEREAQFYQQPLKQQAFFVYFLVQQQRLAARGRGGGLAVWTKVKP